MSRYQELLERKRKEYGPRFSESGLDLRFARFFDSGQRIKVETCGMVLTGRVSVTTGWQPCFILMRTSRSMGSPWTLGTRDKILAVQHGRKYVPVESTRKEA
jgi:hypothetical protein